MGGRPLGISWQDDEASLLHLYRQEQDIDVHPRLNALWSTDSSILDELVRTGRSLHETAQVVGMHYRTLQDWIAWYRAQGGSRGARVGHPLC